MSQIDCAPLAAMALCWQCWSCWPSAPPNVACLPLRTRRLVPRQCCTLLVIMLLAYWITFLLSLVGQVVATWRLEFVKCIHSNYERNASRTSTLCTDFDRFFCCQEDERCCFLQQFLNEFRVLFYSVIILVGITLLLFTLLLTNGIYILIRTKNLSNIFTKSKQARI